METGHGIHVPFMEEIRRFTRKYFDQPYEDKLKIKLSAATTYRPSNPPHFKQLMKLYVKLCTDISRKIIRDIALALGGSADEMEGEISGDPLWVLRTICYPPPPLSVGQDNDGNTIGR
ncbi:homoarginine-6-hydroxylase 2-ODD-C23.1-like [Nicotiana tabacum]|uniref:Homoarginine-6-hydroxylase 2-ODD-C23.1-like n=1 Tax=Nicotiana tabacum TaxID=4097 RepID=A0AC58T2S7_TOBAC